MPPSFPPDIRPTVLRDTAGARGAYAYGAFTLSGAAFQRTSASPPRLLRGPYNTTSPEPFGPGGFSLPCAAFGRPLLTASLLLSFPAGTKMFQFPRVPPPDWECGKSRGRSHSGIPPGSTAACASPGAYRSLPRPSSAPPRAEPSTRRLSCHRAGRFLDQLAYARPSS